MNAPRRHVGQWSRPGGALCGVRGWCMGGAMVAALAWVPVVGIASGADAGAAVVAGFARFARETAAADARLGPIDGGRLLIGELGCVACHRSDAADLAPKGGPDLAGVGVRVDAAWLRRYLERPAAAAPGTTMPHALAAVPATARAATIDALVAHLTTLREPVPLPKPTALNPMPPAFWDRGDADVGGLLYHRVGCVACHAAEEGRAGRAVATGPAALLDEEELIEAGIPLPEKPFASLPLDHVAAKYQRKSLTEFLILPLHARPAGRMPSFDLKAAEAADIAAYLLRHAPEAAAAPQPDAAVVPALAARGREAFVTLRCAACHAGGGDAGVRGAIAAVAPPPPLGEVDPDSTGSCIAKQAAATMSETSQSSAPRYALDDVQRSAIIAALRHLRSDAVTASAAASRDATAARDLSGLEPAAVRASSLDITLMRLNCVACHERDGRGGVGTDRRSFFETVDHVDLGDEGRLPPRLTGVGARLQPAWLAKAVAGGVALRPFMRARMPKYPKDAVTNLPAAFVQADRSATQATGHDVAVRHGRFPPPGDGAALVPAGALLLDSGCVQCHPLGDATLPGTVGVNLAGVTKRVEPEWFRRLLLDPMAVRPGTKMPAFFGATVNRTILDGDAERQIAALWAYLDRPVLEPLPAKLIAAAGDFELVPDERPLVLRTFMERAGTHAIAVGFPAGVHLAFDAERCRLAEAWRGRFLDARGTWVLAKSAPPADPLGADRVVIDGLPPWAVLPAKDAPTAWPAAAETTRFLGYSVDPDGVPSFRYRVAASDGSAAEIAERIVPVGAGPHGGLLRRISAKPVAGSTALPRGLWFRPLAGASLDVVAIEDGARGTVTARDAQPPLTATLDAAVAARAVVRAVEGDDSVRAWTVPFDTDGTTLEVLYRW